MGEIDYDLFTIKADGSRETNLTNSPGVSEVEPNWSPDGQRIAFASERDLDDNDEIYTMRPDGSGVRRLTFTQNVFEGRPNWSPDGRMIAFQSATGDDFDIFTMLADGGDRTLLASTVAFDGLPAWAPDGRQIAFASDRDGDPEVFTMRADGNHPVNLTQNREVRRRPRLAAAPITVMFRVASRHRTCAARGRVLRSGNRRATVGRLCTRRNTPSGPDDAVYDFEVLRHPESS